MRCAAYAGVQVLGLGRATLDVRVVAWPRGRRGSRARPAAACRRATRSAPQMMALAMCSASAMPPADDQRDLVAHALADQPPVDLAQHVLDVARALPRRSRGRAGRRRGGTPSRPAWLRSHDALARGRCPAAAAARRPASGSAPWPGRPGRGPRTSRRSRPCAPAAARGSRPPGPRCQSAARRAAAARAARRPPRPAGTTASVPSAVRRGHARPGQRLPAQRPGRQVQNQRDAELDELAGLAQQLRRRARRTGASACRRCPRWC